MNGMQCDGLTDHIQFQSGLVRLVQLAYVELSDVTTSSCLTVDVSIERMRIWCMVEIGSTILHSPSVQYESSSRICNIVALSVA